MTVFDKWQAWRNADHEDAAVLTRHEIITLLAEITRLREIDAKRFTLFQDRNATIERLEAALREIADDPTGVSLAQADIAREALERK